MASRSLDDLNGTVRNKALELGVGARQAGVPLLIYCTYRSAREQAELWRRGRPSWLIRHRIRALCGRAAAVEHGNRAFTEREHLLARAAKHTPFRGFDGQHSGCSGDPKRDLVAAFLRYQAWLVDLVGPQAGTNRVTNALPLASAHNFGVAFDAVPYVGGKCLWRDKTALAMMGECGEAEGLEWAGRWRRFRESVHFQQPDWLPWLASGERQEEQRP